MKKIISLILAMAIAIMAINFVMAEDKTIIEIESITANSGDTISVPIKVTNNTNGVATVSLTIDYDSNLLTYQNYEKGVYQAETIVNSKTAGQLVVGTMSVSNFTGDGALFTLNFKVNDNADKNVVSEIKLDVSEYYYLDSNYDSISVNRTVNNGIIYINKSVDDTTTESSTTTETTTTEVSTEISTTTETTTITTEVSTKPTTVTEPSTEKQTVTVATETTTETKTEVTTEAKTEATTLQVTEPTETTTAASRPRTSGGGGGSSYRPATTTTATTTTESTTESIIIEETTEVTTITIITKDVKVSVGSNIIYVGDDEFTIDVESYIQTSSNSTMVPLRFVAIAILGDDVENADSSKLISWNADTKTAIITANGKTIKFTAGSNDITVDNKTIKMYYGVKAEIKDGRMFIPFRALGNALGVDVSWDSVTRTAIYKTK